MTAPDPTGTISAFLEPLTLASAELRAKGDQLREAADGHWDRPHMERALREHRKAESAFDTAMGAAAAQLDVAAVVPVGILEQAGRLFDGLAEIEQGSANPAQAQRTYALARALYAAGRSENVDWPGVI